MRSLARLHRAASAWSIGSHSQILLTAGIAIAGAAALCAETKYLGAVVFAAITIALGLMLATGTSPQALLVTWFATSPLASFYFRFPTEKSVVTYDRALIALIALVLIWRPRDTSAVESRASLAPHLDAAAAGSERAARSSPAFSLWISKFEFSWGLLAALAVVSAISQSHNTAYAVKIAVDGFCLPLVMFYFARRYLDFDQHPKALFFAAIGLAWFLFAAGAIEFATGFDLFVYKGSELIREGERRVNGPFGSDSSYAIICLLIAVFLRLLLHLLQVRLDAAARLLLRSALTAVVAACLLPLFRSVALALAACWMVVEISLARWNKRAGILQGKGGPPVSGDSDGAPTADFASQPGPVPGRLASGALPLRSFRSIAFIAVAAVLAGSVVVLTAPRAWQRLANLRNIYNRLATWQVAGQIVLEHPVVGVGLTNYGDYFREHYNWKTGAPGYILDTRPASSPHSNIMWIATDLGLAGLALYAVANTYLFRIGWRNFTRASSMRQRAAATCFLALMIAYWIPGLTLASGYYSDLNLYYFFLLGALSGRSLTVRS